MATSRYRDAAMLPAPDASEVTVVEMPGEILHPDGTVTRQFSVVITTGRNFPSEEALASLLVRDVLKRARRKPPR